MINATILFGNNNRFNIQLDESTVCGDLIYILPIGINKTYKDILYCILNGKLIDGHDLDNLIVDYGIINDECSIYLIFKYGDVSFQDKYIQLKYQRWVEKKYIRHNILQTLQHRQTLIDVQVLIPADDLYMYIENINTVRDVDEYEQCSICSGELLDTDNRSIVKKCGHEFHNPCISQWLTTASVRCPMCNIDVRF